MSRLIIDLHVHTCHSYDTDTDLSELARTFARQGLDAVAITDHSVFGAHREFERYFPGLVIPGEEILTREGEIIGLYLEEEIPLGLSARETVEAIKSQGGLVYVPHPFVRVLPSRLKFEALLELLPKVDAIEILNARNPLPADDLKALRFALAHGLGWGAGSDTHLVQDAGSVKLELEAFSNAAELRQALAHSRVVHYRRIPQHENLYNFLVASKRTGWKDRLRQLLGMAAGLLKGD